VRKKEDRRTCEARTVAVSSGRSPRPPHQTRRTLPLRMVMGSVIESNGTCAVVVNSVQVGVQRTPGRLCCKRMCRELISWVSQPMAAASSGTCDTCGEIAVTRIIGISSRGPENWSKEDYRASGFLSENVSRSEHNRAGTQVHRTLQAAEAAASDIAHAFRK
jgi:hypothetical protein